MKKYIRNICIGAGIAAATFGASAALSYYIAKKFVGIAIDREAPKMKQKEMEQLAGAGDSADNQALIERINAAEQKLLQSEIETVTIQSHDGLKLVGHYKSCPNPKRVIIAMHGWRSSWSRDFAIINEFWEENDCAVLFPEQRAQGNSEGEYITFGLLERYDCRDWIDWVNEKTGDTLPIYLSGISMGATTVLMTAGFDLPDNVKGITADCGFTSPHTIWKHVASDNLHVPYNGLRSFFAEQISKQKAGIKPKEYSTVDAMKVCKVPVWFIHGTADGFVPVEMTYENYEACAAEKQMFIVPNAEHGMSYILDEDGYKIMAKAFWEKCDE